MKTANEQTLWEIQAYGAKKSEILESVTDSITFKFSVQDMPSIEGRPSVRGYNVVRRSDNKNMACFYDYDLAVARANLLNNMAKSRAH